MLKFFIGTCHTNIFYNINNLYYKNNLCTMYINPNNILIIIHYIIIIIILIVI